MLMTSLLLAAQLATSAPTPPYAALASPTLSARYAWENGCLAALRSGTDLAAVANPYIDRTHAERAGTIRTYRMTGAGPVVLVDGLASSSCTMLVARGDPESLKAMVLETRAGQGAWRPLARLANDFDGDEKFCGDIAGQAAYLSISTSKARRRSRLVAYMSVGSSPRCDNRADMGLSRIPDSR
jgi:hypothetical protein